MSRRVFAVIDRGMTDKTAVCVFPWELDILGLVHGGEVKEVSIDEMCDLGAPVKVEKMKMRHSTVQPPNLRQQFEIMAYVDPEEDPAADPGGEYNRLADKYGMDKELPIACVTRVYGEFSSGVFAARLKKHLEDKAEKPKVLRAAEEGLPKAPDQMTIQELRKALSQRGVRWQPKQTKSELVTELEENLAPA